MFMHLCENHDTGDDGEHHFEEPCKGVLQIRKQEHHAEICSP
jgi:hypothetical protein